MRVRGTGSAKVERYESQAEFQAQLLRAVSSLVLGQEIDRPAALFIVRFETGTSVLGVRQEGHGLAPELLMQENGSAWIGYNQSVALVDMADGHLITQVELPHLFYEFVPLPASAPLIVMHELGALALDLRGQRLWQVDGDVVTDFRVEEGELLVSFMDGRTLAVDLRTGSQTTR